MGKADDIQERLTRFAWRSWDAATPCPGPLPVGIWGETALQVRYCGCRELRGDEGAESRNDFIHKLGIVRKELNECLVWLHILEQRGITASDQTRPLRVECDELCRIISASRKTAEANARQKKR